MQFCARHLAIKMSEYRLAKALRLSPQVFRQSRWIMGFLKEGPGIVLWESPQPQSLARLLSSGFPPIVPTLWIPITLICRRPLIFLLAFKGSSSLRLLTPGRWIWVKHEDFSPRMKASFWRCAGLVFKQGCHMIFNRDPPEK